MNKYEKWGCMSADDLTEACIKLEEERDELNMELQSITFDAVALTQAEQELQTLKDAVKGVISKLGKCKNTGNQLDDNFFIVTNVVNKLQALL